MSVNSADMYAQLGVRQQGSIGPQRRTEMGQEDFLRLMTEQLKNQDPLKPMEQGEFIGQMAQFSTVKGIEQMNTGLQNLGLMFGESQALQAASMVGRSAYIGTDIATLEGESGVQGAVTAPGPGPVTVEVRTPGGQLVRSFVVEARAGGAADFHWDGLNANGQPAANGEYRITAKQNATAAQVQVATRIDSVSYTSQGVVLNLVGVGPTTFDRITRIGQA
ncbi:flagellar hook assembly protein FlgD [Aquimonas voraii]|uniref:Basal-body rod modification protein FlgD n=1 Tax=Aquimonas voraii TaxID=265719 RepID=A0A1G6YBY1_9GAMM|nr:flagellar hook capping FlgD N-terminal domain-containing protein [Aquimonas voraii]SDD87840.1 flagellar basal-body rod modification protein FlgD [Aquimonas voraii]